MWKKLFRCVDNFEIDYEQLKMKQHSGAMIVDVRSRQEYEEGHIDGAINFPEYEMNKSNCIKILNNKCREIIVYCQNGGRSKNAYRRLKRFGYEYVYNLHGGIEEIL